MPRQRLIKPEFFKHGELYDAEKVSGLPLRVAFAGLWCQADREGRFVWKPRELKTDVLPHDDCDFSTVLAMLERYEFVRSYVVDGKRYGFIPTFKEHQTFNVREQASRLPAPTSTVHVPCEHQTNITGTGTGRGAGTGTSADGSAFMRMLSRVGNAREFEAERLAMLQGMPGHHSATAEQVERAAADILANMRPDQQVSMKAFRGFVRDEVERSERRGDVPEPPMYLDNGVDYNPEWVAHMQKYHQLVVPR
jgi:hypothetical protein